MSRPKPILSLVLVKGANRVVIDYANGIVCTLIKGDFDVKRFDQFKRLTPAKIESWYRELGYVTEPTTRDKRSRTKPNGSNIVCCVEDCGQPCRVRTQRGKSWHANMCLVHHRAHMAKLQRESVARKKGVA